MRIKKQNNQPNCGMHWWISVKFWVCVDDDDDGSENDSEEENIEEEDKEKEKENGLHCAQWHC